jgi:hypothetical protein
VNNDKPQAEQKFDRRTLVRAGAKAAYMAPVILAAVKATERPAYAQATGAPLSFPVPFSL